MTNTPKPSPAIRTDIKSGVEISKPTLKEVSKPPKAGHPHE